MNRSNEWRSAKLHEPPMYEDIYFTDKDKTLFLGFYDKSGYNSDCGKIIDATYWMWPDVPEEEGNNG